MKKLLIIPIVLVCLTGATSNRIGQGKGWRQTKQDKTQYRPDVKIDRLDSLMKTL